MPEIESPLGILGNIVDKFVLERYLKKLLFKRNELIKTTAERNITNTL